MPRPYDPKARVIKTRRWKTLPKQQAIKPLTPKENAMLYVFQIVMLMLVLLVFFSMLESVRALR